MTTQAVEALKKQGKADSIQRYEEMGWALQGFKHEIEWTIYGWLGPHIRPKLATYKDYIWRHATKPSLRRTLLKYDLFGSVKDLFKKKLPKVKNIKNFFSKKEEGTNLGTFLVRTLWR